MKKIRILLLSISILCAGITLFSKTGIYADWVYYADTTPIEHIVYQTMGVFEYTPDEILPGGNENQTEVELGGNHYALIDLILNENDKGYGLNISNNVVLHRYLKNQPVVFSNQKVSGGNLKFIIDPQNNTHNLYYCIQRISDTEYHAYTFSTIELESAANTNREILAYKTVLIKTDKWNATKSFEGYAQTRPLSYFNVSADSNSIKYSIDVLTWHS